MGLNDIDRANIERDCSKIIEFTAKGHPLEDVQKFLGLKNREFNTRLSYLNIDRDETLSLAWLKFQLKSYSRYIELGKLYEMAQSNNNIDACIRCMEILRKLDEEILLSGSKLNIYKPSPQEIKQSSFRLDEMLASASPELRAEFFRIAGNLEDCWKRKIEKFTVEEMVKK